MNTQHLFYLNPEVIFLNNASFGACPKPVMEEYRKWQIELEKQPVEFLGRRKEELLLDARKKLANFLNCAPDELVYVTNATTALNIVAYSIDLQKNDEILSTDLEYGAMDRMWEIICKRQGAIYRQVRTKLPLKPEIFVNNFIENINSKTKAVFLSHITSSTALMLPVKKIIDYAKKKNIITIIDGAHVPGQLPLNLNKLDADFYTGNCHKWLFAPKGAAFFYARKEKQKLLKPFLISWGRKEFISSSEFIDEYEYQGTRDLAPFLSVPAGIEFNKKYLTQSAKTEIKKLLEYAQNRFTNIFDTPPITETIYDNMQMYAHPLPKHIDGLKLKKKLYDKYKIELPVSIQNNVQYMRISLQIFNKKNDLNVLFEKIKMLI